MKHGRGLHRLVSSPSEQPINIKTVSQLLHLIYFEWTVHFMHVYALTMTSCMLMMHYTMLMAHLTLLTGMNINDHLSPFINEHIHICTLLVFRRMAPPFTTGIGCTTEKSAFPDKARWWNQDSPVKHDRAQSNMTAPSQMDSACCCSSEQEQSSLVRSFYTTSPCQVFQDTYICQCIHVPLSHSFCFISGSDLIFM